MLHELLLTTIQSCSPERDLSLVLSRRNEQAPLVLEFSNITFSYRHSGACQPIRTFYHLKNDGVPYLREQNSLFVPRMESVIGTFYIRQSQHLRAFYHCTLIDMSVIGV